ncbi:MAG TPA: hypothetical protein VF306_02795 [Pirellulales bacterium]
MAAALLAWSSGKDSAWALEILRREAQLDVVGLVTTFNEAFDRVAMHAVRRELVEAQADAVGLPLWPMNIPWPCPNGEYERRMRAVLAEARRQGITHFAFGDLYLADIRRYRESLLLGSGIEPLFPLWCSAEETPVLAWRMLAAGLSAVITCVDPNQLDGGFVGRRFDASLLDELPPGIDACGERGEFHTFCTRGPMFARELAIEVGEIVQRDGFWFADVYSPCTSSR